METSSVPIATIRNKRDYLFGIAAGLIIGALLMPILQTAKPELYLSLKFVIIPIFTVLVPLGLVIASWISHVVPIIWQLAKFIVIGVLNTLVDIGALAYMLYLASLSSNHIASSDILFTFLVPIAFFTLYKSISFVIANVNSYFWNKYWTFGANDGKKSSTEFVQFFIVSFIGFIINVAASSFIFSTFHKIGGMTPDQWALVGAAAGSVSGLAWNFIGYKFIVFKK